MKRLVCIVFILQWLLTGLWADDPGRVQPAQDLVWKSGFVHLGAALWAGGGAGIANPDNPEALLYNPAWRTEAKNLLIGGGLRRLGATLGYATDTLGINNQIVFPNYLLGVSRYGSWMFQAGYREFYNTRLHMDIPVSYNDPQLSREVVSHYDDNSVYEFFIGANKAVKKHLSIGAQTGLVYQYISSKTDDKVDASGDGYGYAFTLGIDYQPVEQAGLALTYRYVASIDHEFTFSRPVYVNNKMVTRTMRFPWLLDGSLYFVPVKWLRINLKMEYQEWKKVMSKLDNCLQLALGLNFYEGKRLSARTGYFTMGRYLNGGKNFEDVAFLTAGIDYRIHPNLVLTFSALTSHFFAGKDMAGQDQLDQTEILLGIRLTLPRKH